MKKFLYPSPVPVHFYSRAAGGFIIFYRMEDYLVFYTLYSSEIRKAKLDNIAFCLMPNHYHAVIRTTDCRTVLAVLSHIERRFSRMYNSEYGMKGRLFDTPVGWAPKATGKLARSAVVYVVNNPVVGGLSPSALTYRWNLLAYRHCPVPFSSRFDRSRCRLAFRRALELVDSRYAGGFGLGYRLIRNLARGLTGGECGSLYDYIIYKYRCLDVSGAAAYFGGESMMEATVEATAGSEYDLPDDFEDWSVYAKMGLVMEKLGIRPECNVVMKLSEDGIVNLVSRLMADTAASPLQIRKFLRLKKITASEQHGDAACRHGEG